MKRYIFFSLALAMAGMIGGCSSSTDSANTGPTTYTDTSVTFFGGTAQTWVKLDANGNPTSVGLTLSKSALANLPQDSSAHVVFLDFPSEVSKTPFDHMEVDWNPYGHPPPGVYDKPHFDFHFYTITKDAQMQIPGGSDMTPLDTTLYPLGYTTSPDHESVPMMGVHYSPMTDFTTPGQFKSTMIYGFSKGKFCFLEPMITKAFIEGNTDVSFPIPQPQQYAYQGKYFPTSYSVSTDPSDGSYSISLDSLVLR